MFFFFFFQAEDGIRDFHVTGVQTCALPISRVERERLRDLDDLAIPDADRGYTPRGPQIGAKEAEQVTRLALHLGSVDQTGSARRRPVCEDVLRHREPIDEAELLEDGADPGRDRVTRP